MKKILLLLVLWVMAAFMPAISQETLTVYDCDAFSNYVPVYGLYADAYNKCQMIMPADDLSDMVGCTISKMSWRLYTSASAAWGGNFQIYISEVSQTIFTSSDFLDISGATLVYEGPLDGTRITMDIEFTQSYTYGGGNLLISVYETEKGSWSNATFAGKQAFSASISKYSYSDFEDIFYATFRDFLPWTVFTMAPNGGVVHRKPTNLEVSDITTHSATFTWEAGSDETSWGVEYKNAVDEEWTSAGTVTEKTITLDALANGVKYDVRVRSIYADGESGWAKISFSTLAFEEIDMTLTPTAAYTPNNVQTDPAEDYHKLFDKDRSTKWYVDNCTGSWDTIWVDFKSDTPFIPTSYIMTTGNDTQRWWGRNPNKWKIYAKANENDDWTTIVNVTNGAAEGLGTNNTTDYSFEIDGVNSPYQYFRFEVSAVRDRGGSGNNHYVFQLAELKLLGTYVDAPEPPIPGDLNGDGSVDVSDVNAVINMMLGKMTQTAAGDVTGDGNVDVSDVNAVINIMLGKTTPVTPPVVDPTPQTLTAIGYNTPHNTLDATGDEGYAKLVDGDRNTKWCVVNNTGAWATIWIDLKCDVAFKPTSYIMTTGNDTQSFIARNPKNWKIYGRNSESESWTELVHVTDGAQAGLGTENTTDYTFQFNGITQAYKYYRFEVIEIGGCDIWNSAYYIFQLGELTLVGVAQ